MQPTQESLRPSITRPSRKGTLDVKEDISSNIGELSQPERTSIEVRKSERRIEDRTPSPLTERRTRTEVNSPDKLIQSPALTSKHSSSARRKSQPEIPSEETKTLIIPTTVTNNTEGDDYKLGQAKRRYIIRNMKKSQTQEEMMKYMQNFEEKVAKLIKENKDNAGGLQIHDLELPGHHGYHRQALSWGGSNGVKHPLHCDSSSHTKDPVHTNIPTDHLGTTTTQEAKSEKINWHRNIFDAKRAELSSSQESRRFTKRLVSSLHIRKNSDLHAHLATFSDQIHGISRREDTKKTELTMERPNANSPPRSATLIVQTQSTPNADKFSVVPMISVASYASNRSSLAQIFQAGSQTTRELSSREALTTREQSRQSKRTTGEKFNIKDSAPLTPNKILLAKKKERVALNSFKKIREINKYAISTSKANSPQNKFFSVAYIKSVSNT